jgi:hypothetical protein
MSAAKKRAMEEFFVCEYFAVLRLSFVLFSIYTVDTRTVLSEEQLFAIRRENF